MAEQNFENHGKVVPAFHFVAVPIFTFNLGWAVYRASHHLSGDTLVALLVAIALLDLAFLARIFALRVQDRVIRLEMRLRLRELLPDDLRGRVGQFSLPQLISLRFAGDAELPALARRVLEENLQDRKAIKKLVKDWQADTLRA